MKWVKASEKMPEDRVICRWHHSGNPDLVHIDILGVLQIQHPDRENYDIEWLDESASPSPSIEELAQKLMEENPYNGNDYEWIGWNQCVDKLLELLKQQP